MSDPVQAWVCAQHGRPLIGTHRQCLMALELCNGGCVPMAELHSGDSVIFQRCMMYGEMSTVFMYQGGSDASLLLAVAEVVNPYAAIAS